MLTRLDISNYALIENVQLEFKSGYSVITGETGAGKSILLKALNLLLGDRADYSVINQNENKCVLEAEFNIASILDQSYFESIDLDYEPHTIIRREFTANGKSRVFVNDTPASVAQIKQLGSRLVNIHTQHQTLQLFEAPFQMSILDDYATITEKQQSYKSLFQQYKNKLNQLDHLRVQESENRKEKDYKSFLLTEFESLPLDKINVEELEQEHLKIQNWEQIKSGLNNALSIFQQTEYSPIESINQLMTALHELKDIDSTYNELMIRLNSVKIELQDIESEMDQLSDQEDLDEERAKVVEDLIESINSLAYKHNVKTISELIEVKNQIESELNNFSSIETDIEQLEAEVLALQSQLDDMAQQLNDQRVKAIPSLEKLVSKQLSDLLMPEAELKLQLTQTDTLNVFGKNKIEFLFKTNLGGEYLEVKKSASGGELSRLMLVLLSISAAKKTLPTLIFDEIDTGVSGEVASRIANTFYQLGQDTQIISITHLPQVAAKAHQHFHVSKSNVANKTQTKVQLLNMEGRVNELAKMMSGEEITSSAIENAKQLLNHTK